jgi:hypothetical protein
MTFHCAIPRARMSALTPCPHGIARTLTPQPTAHQREQGHPGHDLPPGPHQTSNACAHGHLHDACGKEAQHDMAASPFSSGEGSALAPPSCAAAQSRRGRARCAGGSGRLPLIDLRVRLGQHHHLRATPGLCPWLLPGYPACQASLRGPCGAASSLRSQESARAIAQQPCALPARLQALFQRNELTSIAIHHQTEQKRHPAPAPRTYAGLQQQATRRGDRPARRAAGSLPAGAPGSRGAGAPAAGCR